MKPFLRSNRHRQMSLVWVLSLVLAVPQFFRRQALGQQSPALVGGVDAIGITVSDMDRAVDFYSKVLTFEKVSDAEVAGENYEHLEGVFGLRMRVVRMRLGGESIELTNISRPRAAQFQWIRAAMIAGSSTSPSLLATWTRHMPGCGRTRWNMLRQDHSGFQTGTRTRRASRPSTLRIQMSTRLRCCNFHPTRAWRSGTVQRISCFSVSTIPQS